MKNALISTILLALFASNALAEEQAECEDSSGKPNILIIMTDQQFADAMSCVQGREYLQTPYMDSIAANGMRFTRAYCANPICQPSRTSTFTGRYPHETGIQDNSRHGFDVEKYPMMGAVFRDAGYDTGYTGKWHIRFSTSPHNPRLSERDAAIHGFDFIDQTRVNSAESLMKGDCGRVAPGIEFIKKERDKPFFLVVSCMNPHNICEWARGDRLPDGDIGDPSPLEQCPPLLQNHLPPEGETDVMAYMRSSYQHTSTFPVRGFDDKKWREYIWAYYRMVEMVDAEIGKVLSALKDTGQEEDTVVIFLSDHGDCHGAHKWNQKTVFYDESARVPLIISWKGKTPQGTSDVLVNTGVDLLPTLCDFARIEPPPGLPGKSLKAPTLSNAPDWMPGASLKPLAMGEKKELERDYVVSQNRMVQGAPVDGKDLTPDGRMIRSRRYKYCLYSEGKRRESLVDMQNDPGEMVNQAENPRFGDVLRQHRSYLKEFANTYNDSVALKMLEFVE